MSIDVDLTGLEALQDAKISGKSQDKSQDSHNFLGLKTRVVFSFPLPDRM
jgi:hypothetical protein